MDVGQSQLFTLSVTGGASPYTYQWYLNDAPVSGATSSSWMFAPSSSGSYTVYVNATDNVGATAKSNIATVTVNTALSVSISPTSVVMDVGQSQQFTSTVSDGTSPYTYQWYSNGTAINGATSSTYTFTPTSPDHYNIYVKVADNVGIAATSNTATVAVNSALSVTISPISVTMDLGQSKQFTSSISGGTSPYSCQWYLNDAPVSGATSNSWTFTPTSSGSYTVKLTVQDAAVNTASATTTIVVQEPQPTPTPSPSPPTSTATPTPVSTSPPTSTPTSTPTPTATPTPTPTPSPSPSPTASPNPTQSSLPPEAIYGIATGVIIVAIVAVVLVLRKSKKGKS
jgi:tetrahydromethanopterin S-methyltransferase subunit B